MTDIPTVAEVVRYIDKRGMCDCPPDANGRVEHHLPDCDTVLARRLDPDTQVIVDRDNLAEALRLTRWWTHNTPATPEDWSNGDLADAILAALRGGAK